MAFIPPTPLPLSCHSAARHAILAFRPSRHATRPRPVRMSASPEPTPDDVSVPLASVQNPTPASSPLPGPQAKDPRTEKQKEMDRLRAAEKFIAIDEGNYECLSCGYVYEPEKGVAMMDVAKGTPFDDLPDAFTCPVCRSPKTRFVSKKKIIAGFADNQKYGFGSNGMTGGEKSGWIFGGLLFFFLLLLSGYALN